MLLLLLLLCPLVAGLLSMVTSGIHSNGSQFYISLGACAVSEGEKERRSEGMSATCSAAAAAITAAVITAVVTAAWHAGYVLLYSQAAILSLQSSRHLTLRRMFLHLRGTYSTSTGAAWRLAVSSRETR